MVDERGEDAQLSGSTGPTYPASPPHPTEEAEGQKSHSSRVLRTTVLWETFLKYQGWLVSSWECEWHSLQLAIACVKYNVSVIFLLPLLLFSLLSLP